ncbi:MAG: EAL domain-containing protein [Gallionellaceae bacterium]
MTMAIDIDTPDFPFSESLINSLPSGVVFHDASGQIIRANPFAKKILGLTMDQMRGATSIDPRWHATHEDLSPFPGEQHPAMIALKTHQPVLNVVMGVFNPLLDNQVWISVSAFPCLDPGHNEIKGVHAIFEDITEKIHARKNQLESDARFKSLFEAMSEGMAFHRIIYDDQGIAKDYLILDVNPAFEAQTGLQKSMVVGKLASEAYQTDEPPFLDIYAEVARTYQPKKFEKYFAPLDKHFQINVFSPSKDHFATVFHDITELKKNEETIFDMAFFDPLTHLPNLKLLIERLQQSLLSSVKQPRFCAILLINLDDFKSLNDSKGRDVGDLLLIEITDHLRSSVHATDTIARIGGDEFVVLLDTLDLGTEAAEIQSRMVAERILAKINQPLDLRGHAYHCSASVGITIFNSQRFTPQELLKHADVAMHQAKRSGRNTISFFDPAAEIELESRIQLESWMHKALEDQYRLYYQIQVDGDGVATGAEALIRWQHPKKGMISPAEFIPLAEETGLILPIGKWVLETACNQLKAWQNDPRYQHLLLAVNVSAKQFQQPDFAEQVLAVIERTGADPHKLKLELTESILVAHVEDIISKMLVLKSKGIKFSLDDFGTGFSSLSILKRLPLNQLKIDQSFVHHLLSDPNDAAIVRTVIALGQSFGLEVIAEGVETEEQRNSLAVYGCQHYQGYLYSKPLPLADFEALLLQPLK